MNTNRQNTRMPSEQSHLTSSAATTYLATSGRHGVKAGMSLAELAGTKNLMANLAGTYTFAKRADVVKAGMSLAELAGTKNLMANLAGTYAFGNQSVAESIAKNWGQSVGGSLTTPDLTRTVLDTLASVDAARLIPDEDAETLDKSAVGAELDSYFATNPDAEEILAKAPEVLGLVLPFGYDLTVRRSLQVTVVLATLAVLVTAYGVSPPLAVVLSAIGTPNVPVVWRATGRAYDHLYGEGQNRPPTVEAGTNSPPTTKTRRPGGGPPNYW